MTVSAAFDEEAVVRIAYTPQTGDTDRRLLDGKLGSETGTNNATRLVAIALLRGNAGALEAPVIAVKD